MKRILLLLMYISVYLSSINATEQQPEYLIYKGDTLMLRAEPLWSYFNDDRPYPSGIFKMGSTACWRGYRGYWELRNDSLFLNEVRDCFEQEIIPLSQIFKDRDTSKPIFADWVTGKYFQPYGKRLVFITDYLIYEYENWYTFNKGILKKKANYDNRRTRLSPYSNNDKLLVEFIRKEINYNNVPTVKEKIRVVVRFEGVDKNGKINKVKLLKNPTADKRFAKEAIRAVKAIPQWNVIYKQGKPFHIYWTMPITFLPEEDRK